MRTRLVNNFCCMQLMAICEYGDDANDDDDSGGGDAVMTTINDDRGTQRG